MTTRWEVGSEFDWSEDAIACSSDLPNLLPNPHELFSTATGILLSICDLLKVDGCPLKVHLPSLFCMHVASHIQQVASVRWYRDLPTDSVPCFETLQPSPGDIVVAVNLFGIKKQQPWKDWLQRNPDIILIEDHTHDPFSHWAKTSNAHYAIASLRKTLPIPDGGIVWSPQGLEIPKPSSPQPWGSYYKLMAMLLKRAFLKGTEVSKDNYRFLQTQGEKYLSNEISSGVSILTRELINYLDITTLRQKREENIKYFLELISANKHHSWKPLFRTWEVGEVPFNCVILCQDYQVRETLRKYLISHNIFTAVHWQQPLGNVCSHDSLAIDLSNRLLTVPLDYRYSIDDIDIIVDKLGKFEQVPSA